MKIYTELLRTFEVTAIDMLLATSKHCNELKIQLDYIVSVKRDFTGVGFFVDFSFQSIVPKIIEKNFVLGNVEADIEQCQSGGAFLLFVRDGIISCLEGYCYEEIWKPDAKVFNLRYFTPIQGIGGRF